MGKKKFKCIIKLLEKEISVEKLLPETFWNEKQILKLFFQKKCSFTSFTFVFVHACTFTRWYKGIKGVSQIKLPAREIT